MDEPVKYKKPARINVVSVSLALGLGVLVLLGWQYIPLYLLKQEAYRVLEETGSVFSGRKGMYLEDPLAREELRGKMERDLRAVGIDDQDAETWIDVEGKEVRLGIAYGKWIEWPFDVIARSEKVYEVEHVLVLD